MLLLVFFASEWCLADSGKSNLVVKHTLYVKWHPPFSGWHKINTDGSCIQDANGFGPIAAGGLIRDDSGSWVSGFVSFLGHGCSLLAELCAIFLGVQLALTKGLVCVIVECDCKLAVDLLNCLDSDSHHLLSCLSD